MRAGVDVDQLTDAMLTCKVVGHAWDPFTPHRKPPAFGDLMAWLCTRCTAERHDIVSGKTGGGRSLSPIVQRNRTTGRKTRARDAG